MQIDCEITERLGIISQDKSEWTKEFNRVLWDGRYDKYDIRSWSPTRRPSKGITFTFKELKELYRLIGSEIKRREGYNGEPKDF